MSPSRFGTVFWDFGSGSVVSGGKGETRHRCFAGSGAETGAQEGRQGRALLDDRQVPN